MDEKKETTPASETKGRQDAGKTAGNVTFKISRKKRGLDYWYPRLMTIFLALNLLLQILILVLRW